MLENPIDNMEFKGDWSPQSKNYSWDKVSRDILTNPKGVEKIKKIWRNAAYNYIIYFIKSPQAFKNGLNYSGLASTEKIKQLYGVDIQPNADSITLVYTNNIGSPKEPMTGWIMAHRFAHMIASSSNNYVQKIYYELVKKIEKDCAKTIEHVYNIKKQPDYYRSELNYKNSRKFDLLLLKFASMIGTMKSARDANVPRFSEFVHELFAQYVLKGYIKLNRLSKPLIMRYNWGNPEYRYPNSNNLADANQDIEDYEELWSHYMDEILSNCVGGIFIF